MFLLCLLVLLGILFSLLLAFLCLLVLLGFLILFRLFFLFLSLFLVGGGVSDGLCIWRLFLLLYLLLRLCLSSSAVGLVSLISFDFLFLDLGNWFDDFDGFGIFGWDGLGDWGSWCSWSGSRVGLGKGGVAGGILNLILHFLIILGKSWRARMRDASVIGEIRRRLLFDLGSFTLLRCGDGVVALALTFALTDELEVECDWEALMVLFEDACGLLSPASIIWACSD